MNLLFLIGLFLQVWATFSDFRCLLGGGAYVRPKLACVACHTIFQASAPGRPIALGLVGAGLLAHVLATKYCDHHPRLCETRCLALLRRELNRSPTLDGFCLLEPDAQTSNVFLRMIKDVVRLKWQAELSFEKFAASHAIINRPDRS